MMSIAIPIRLTHDSFGAIVFTFDKAVRNARRQKLKKRQNFPPPLDKRGEDFDLDPIS